MIMETAMFHLLKRLRKTLQALFSTGRPGRSGFSLSMIGQWWPLLRPYRGLCVAIVLLSVATGVISSILPLSTKIVIDWVTQKTGLPELSEIVRVCLGVFVLLLLFHLLSFFLQILSFRLEQQFVSQLQMHLFKRVLRFPTAFFGRRTSHYLTQRILGDVSVAQSLLHSGATQILTHAFRVLGCLLVLFHLSGVLTVAVVSSIPVFAVVSFFFASRALNISWNELEKEARVGEEVQESFAGIETVKAFNTYMRQEKRLSDRFKEVYATRERELLAGLLSHYAERSVQIAVFLVVLGLGIREVVEGRLTAGGLVAFFSNMGILTLSVSELLQIHLLSQPSVAALQRIMRLLKKSGEGKRPRQQSGESCAKAMISSPGEIRFADVTFGYDPGRMVLKHLSFRVQRGQILALIGRSGIGKTTVAKLLQGFYRPQSGEILLDGVSIRALDLLEYREKIGYVSQDLFLFRDSVANNIAIACRKVEHADLIRVCEKARIHHEIEGLPQGYDTIVGERGATLSVGQRQRLAIARALMHRPSIFILDEPTSALDTETENALLEALKSELQQGITIIISHKPSVAAWADVVVRLDDC